MGAQLSSETARIFTEHVEDADWSVARFVWHEGEPQDFFEIPVDNLLIRFDAHFPVRPDTVTLPDNAVVNSEATLGKFFGNTVAEAIMATQHNGFGTLESVLSPTNRRALAELQHDWPFTPPLIRRLTESMVDTEELPRFVTPLETGHLQAD